MNLIKERDLRTKKRKKAKQKLDREITLSSSLPETDNMCKLSLNRSEGKVRLLDEGSIVTANNQLRFYIKKGVLKKYLSGKNKNITYRSVYGDVAEELFDEPDKPLNIDDNFEGSINVGHHDFSEFPFVVGNFTKGDLSLVDNGEGRKGLDVELKLNEAHPFVQAWRLQGIPLGVSVEMFMHRSLKDTEAETARRGELTPVIDEIYISDFAVVGECGNVGSSESIDFQGVKMENPDKEMLLEAVDDLEEEEVVDEVEDEETVTEDTESVEDEIEEESEDEQSEEVEINESTEDEESVADEEVDVDEVEEDEEDEHEEVTLSMVLDKVNELTNKVSELASQNDMLKKQNRKLKGKLQAKNEAEKEFFQGLSISLGGQDIPKKEEKVKKTKMSVSADYANGDGIGE